MSIKNTNPQQTFGKEDDVEIRIRKIERITNNYFSQLSSRIGVLEKKITSLERKNV